MIQHSSVLRPHIFLRLLDQDTMVLMQQHLMILIFLIRHSLLVMSVQLDIRAVVMVSSNLVCQVHHRNLNRVIVLYVHQVDSRMKQHRVSVNYVKQANSLVKVVRLYVVTVLLVPMHLTLMVPSTAYNVQSVVPAISLDFIHQKKSAVLSVRQVHSVVVQLFVHHVVVTSIQLLIVHNVLNVLVVLLMPIVLSAYLISQLISVHLISFIMQQFSVVNYVH